MKTFLKWTRRALAGVLFLLVATLMLGLLYQTFETWQTERLHPPPGELVDVGGHRLHIHSLGSGGPSVVLDAGLSGASYDWEDVAGKISKFTTVSTYDRAGYGWSDAGPFPRTSQQCVAELKALADKSLKKPFILVAHSWAGLHARLYASKYPQDIAGLVLVDSLNYDRLPEEAIRGQVSSMFRILNMTAKFGTVRFAIPHIMTDRRSDRNAVEFRCAMLSRTKSAQAIYGELTGQSNWKDVRSEMRPLEIPVVVISHHTDVSQADHDLAEGDRYWETDQKALLGISKNSKFVMSKTTEHNIQFYELDTIVQAVRDLVDITSRTK